jgi:3-oxoacyl-[acyl-carrier protein] reductase
MSDHDGRRVIVTGASRGIGRGVAEAFAEAGAVVGVNYPPVDAEEGEATVEDFATLEGRAVALEADVTDEAAVEGMIDAFVAEAGGLDTLVNNAGGTLQNSPIEEMSEALWDRVVDLNLKGPFLTSKHAAEHLRAAEDPAIINVTSQLAFLGRAGKVHYTAAKGGLVSMTRTLARELGPEVRVNGVAPGPIRTGKRDEADAAWAEARTETIPLGRIGEVEDVAPTVLFLAGDDAGYYTGQVLNPDGGEAMH